MVNIAKLEKRISIISSYDYIAQTNLEKLKNFIITSDSVDLTRITLFSLTEQFLMDNQTISKLFIAAAKAGIFELEWNLVCPICGGLENHNSISEINKNTHFCILCEKDAEVDLNSDVEITFTLRSDLFTESIDQYQDKNTYLNFHFSKSLSRPLGLEEFISSVIKEYFTISQSETKRITFKKLKVDTMYHLISLDKSKSLRINVRNEAPAKNPIIIDMELNQTGFFPSTVNVPPCDLTLSLKNMCTSKTGFIIKEVDAGNAIKAAKVYSEEKITFKPFLTGKKLLNNQSFRNLYKSEDIPANLHIKASDVTILFTDLKGSTELYEKTGDLKAYSLVQEHFDLLTAVVDLYEGALIKTIGDAVMAAFSNSKDAVSAAHDMVQQIEKMNKENLDY
ncbi:MAG: hypothetical protein B6229_09835 [Spirochaetaceae bacterium 4572_7]|nr:MAG: hypothetical protein B6229_09835 [Spirochaetaceae bacterium 4572_7]